jgi:transposase
LPGSAWKGRPLYVELTPGQQHEATLAESLIEHACGKACIADAGYEAGYIRQAIRDRGMKDVIPSNPTRRKILRYDKKLYRQRYLVEVFFHSLKSFRRIATRYEKTARNYLAIVHLACALHWLKPAA